MEENINGKAAETGGGGTDKWPEKMKLSEARMFLGVSHQKITDLVKRGSLKTEVYLLDRRVKLVRLSDLKALKIGLETEAGGSENGEA